MTMFFDREIERFLRGASRPFFETGAAAAAADDLLEDLRGEGPAVSGPLYYGYTMTVGPDGRPVVREYGNIRPGRGSGAAGGGDDDGTLPDAAREPAVETIVDDKDGAVKLIAEMPGVEKADVKVLVDNGTVDIGAERGDKKYRVRVPVRQRIDEKSGQASYKNGILQVVFKRVDEEPAGTTVEVR